MNETQYGDVKYGDNPKMWMMPNMAINATCGGSMFMLHDTLQK